MTLLLLIALFQDADVDALCKRLANDDPETRDRATAELVKIGRSAVEAVKKLLASDDAEVRSRAQKVLDAIRVNLRAKALKLDVKCDRKKYAPGETVKIEATLANVEDFPVVAMKSIPDGGLTAGAWISVTRDGKAHNVAGGLGSQVMVHGRVTEDRFLTIKPKEAPVVRGLSFSAVWDLGGKDPSLTASYQDAKTVPLKAGTYTVKATYGFKFDRESIDEDDSFKGLVPATKRTFEGRAKEMLLESWTGTVTAETQFEVVKK